MMVMVMTNTTTITMMMRLRMMIITTGVLLPHLVGGPWICGSAPPLPNVPHRMLRACTSTSTETLVHKLPPKHLHRTSTCTAQSLLFSRNYPYNYIVQQKKYNFHCSPTCKRQQSISVLLPGRVFHLHTNFHSSVQQSTFAWENVPPPSYLSHGGSWGRRGGLRTLSSSA